MIRIVTLVENTSREQHLRSKHGLSLYVATPHHKLLFDLGPNSLFAENAEKLGVDIAVLDVNHYRSDMDCFVPLMEKFHSLYGFYPLYPVADAGYG